MHTFAAKAILMSVLTLFSFLNIADARPTDLQRIGQNVSKNSSTTSNDDSSIRCETTHDTLPLVRRAPTLPLARVKAAKEKGLKLFGYLNHPDTAPETPWKAYKELGEWGWVDNEIKGDQAVRYGTQHVDDVLRYLDVPLGAPDNVEHFWQHVQTVTKEVVRETLGGVETTEESTASEVSEAIELSEAVTDRSKMIKKTVTFPATDGSYTNTFNTEDGVIIARANYGPEFVTKGQFSAFPKGAELPELRQWSDIIYLTWAQMTDESRCANLRWVIRSGITNPETISLVRDVTRGVLNPTGKPPAFPGVTVKKYKTGPLRSGHTVSDDWLVLLGTPNVRGVVYLLAQHPDMGEKTIGDILVWDRETNTQEVKFNFLIAIVPK